MFGKWLLVPQILHMRCHLDTPDVSLKIACVFEINIVFLITTLYYFQKRITESKQISLHEELYFPSPGISWKIQKDQVNIIFPWTFSLRKGRIFHLRKVQNKNFSRLKTKTFQ